MGATRRLRSEVTPDAALTSSANRFGSGKSAFGFVPNGRTANFRIVGGSVCAQTYVQEISHPWLGSRAELCNYRHINILSVF